ncbi:MAG: hypothetical protein A2931_01545 [Candidatus Niyogibacteria bacterium RIFCSPLOWO2_01_FULL_45_48]|uniref:Uncharacterized protein n=2 Tax=Candidatus Niyogiibacteriota TaxID=1817912 RepID=A0A1G2EZ06_9BACT|nr:MAG: hypothetical protein A2931_01545 [Candidatus Niyogibacteria bacterium RIFCSPLOWO2_01_FULL_45_48]OGZ29989.1 MAG: hypothetical protein A2835_02890 [Candidatus Niyogibacteria bacterium RIFCSPHIGHO2_01_FULL_45_28]OGZ31054.1 MAG: hypothetical protein A3J00_03110 [Candidatus Niyogibacteria bacterium RIFCSPLOWO2_02_FULL_45_13]
MNSVLAKLLLIGFIAIAVFGFLAMGHSFGEWCLASAANRSACPAGIGGAVSFYANAFKSFSLAVFAVAGTVLLVAVFEAISRFTIVSLLPNLSQVNFYHHPEFFKSFSETRALRWLSLHENSPTSA